MNDYFSLYVLLSHPDISPAVARQLIQLFGSAEAVLCESKNTIKPPDGVRNSLWKKLKNPEARKKAEKEWRKIEKQAVAYLDYRDDDFPILLNHVHDGPLLLFYRGNPFPRSDKIISIVGTRKPTKDALVFTKDIVEAIKHVNPIIISGLAEGINASAHHAALDEGLQTYACLAHGVNRFYPSFHKKLKSQIEQQGGTLTEHSLDSPLHPGYFLRRNRIIAGLSHATIVVANRKKEVPWLLVNWLLTIIEPYLPYLEVQTTQPNWGATTSSKKMLRSFLTSPLIFSPQWSGRPKKIEQKIHKQNSLLSSTMTKKSYSNISIQHLHTLN